MVDDDERWVCFDCGAEEPPIFLCEAGWWCEDCYRKWSGVPDELPSQELHDGINDGSQAGYIEVVKAKVFDEHLEELGIV